MEEGTLQRQNKQGTPDPFFHKDDGRQFNPVKLLKVRAIYQSTKSQNESKQGIILTGNPAFLFSCITTLHSRAIQKCTKLGI